MFLINDAHNTFYIQLYGADICYKTTQRERKLAAVTTATLRLVVDRIAHTTAYFDTSGRTLAGTRHSAMGPPLGINPTIH